MTHFSFVEKNKVEVTCVCVNKKTCPVIPSHVVLFFFLATMTKGLSARRVMPGKGSTAQGDTWFFRHVRSK